MLAPTINWILILLEAFAEALARFFVTVKLENKPEVKDKRPSMHSSQSKRQSKNRREVR